MAFPVVQARATGVQGVNTTSHAITLPAGIVAGEMLVVVFSVDGNPTVTAPAGWTKLGQASNGTTVTGAVFWRIAAGSDTLTLTTSASEQSSYVAFRISDSLYLNGTSANGSSTNSNPPLLTPAGGSAEYLWIATRSGDASVVATVAPSGFSNIQTQVGGGQGASTNTAELTLVATSQDPGMWASATEQWVSWTLAAYRLIVQQTFAAAYASLAEVSQSLTAGYAVLAPEAGGPAWFSRLTNGFNTWAAYGSAALVVTAEFDAAYRVETQVSTVFTASYRAGEATAGVNLGWFPRLTDGANTWAGESVPETTGVINGGGDLPLVALNSFAGTYLVGALVSNTRTALYQIRSTVSQNYSAEYTANGVVSTFQLFEYQVAQPAVQTFAADYTVLGIIGSVANTYATTYRILASATRGFSASYQVFNTSTVQTTFSATFNVVSEVTASLTAGWWVALEPLDPPATFDADYLVYEGATDSLEIIYQVIARPEATLEIAYDVGSVRLGDQTADVYRYGRAEVNR